MPFKDPKKQKQYDKLKYQKNRERIIRLRMKRYRENKESEARYQSAYAKKHRKRLNKYLRHYKRNMTEEQRRRENESVKKWRRKNKDKLLATVQRWQRKHPYKAVAQAALVKAIQVGLIIRPKECSHCKKQCKPHGHHTDYSKLLEVIWLCPLCHKHVHLGLIKL